MMIRTHELTKVYRTEHVETWALNNVNITIDAGEFVAIMGPSGCGKSTLLNTLGFLDTPSSGSYFFDGHETSVLTEREQVILRRKDVGFIFQSFNLIDDMSVFDNVALPLTYLNVSKAELKERVEAALEGTQITHRAQHYPSQLSGGQQQRVAVARAIVKTPKLLLADEPTGNLDSSNSEEIMQLLGEINAAGTTIVMVTHSEQDAQACHRTIRLFDGTVVEEEEAVTRIPAVIPALNAA